MTTKKHNQGRTLLRSRLILSAIVASGLVGLAGAADPPSKAAPPKPATASAPAAATTLSAEEKAKLEILSSERWAEATHWLNEWLSVQQIYTPAEVAQMRKDFDAKITKMSVAELRQLLVRMESKLTVLMSPEAADARRWLGNFLGAQARYSDEELAKMRPDIVNMTASQLEAELAQFNARRASRVQAQEAFDQARQSQVAADRQRRAQQASARQQAAMQPRSFQSFYPQSQSQYAPRRPQRQPSKPNLSVYTGPWGAGVMFTP
ncbi:MAG: hypothetical protein K2Y37_05755 [Pirellulales bacterium]|nr:hypothetical protein [Pirellulales bacterium]